MNKLNERDAVLNLFNEAKKHFPQLQRPSENHHIGNLIFYSSAISGFPQYVIEMGTVEVAIGADMIQVKKRNSNTFNFDIEIFIEAVLNELMSELAKKLTKELMR
jgi:hypothetical protein